MPTTVSISGGGSRAEGTGGNTSFTYTVTRSGDLFGASIVDVWTAAFGGQGKADGSDFAGNTSGSVYFAAGEATKTFTLNVAGDSLVELDEAFDVNLSNARGATIEVGRVTSTIVNDDGGTTPPATQLSWGNPSSGVSRFEGDSGATTFTYVVNRSGNTSGTTVVDYAAGPVSGASNSAAQDDFVAGTTSGRLTFAPGELSKEIVIQVRGDTAQETDEPFEVRLFNSPGATLPSPIPGRILNDDGAPPTASLSISGPPARAEGNEGTTPFNFTVTRTGDTSGLTLVDYYLVGDTNTADFFGSNSGTLYFSAGETSRTITVHVMGDTTREADEGFFIGLSNARNGVIETQRATTVILNDDSDTPPASTLTWGSSTQGINHNEGDSGTTAFTYVLNRGGNTSGTTTATWTVTGQADASDFATPMSGTVTFGPGELSKEIVLQVNGDTVQEGDETFQIALSNSPGATLPSPIPGKILNDDGGGVGPSTVSISGAGSHAEGTGANTVFDFSVTRTGDTTGTTLVDYWMIGDTNAADFTGPTTGTLYFAAGETSKVIHINVVGDSTPEPDESFNVGLSNPRGGTIGVGSAPGRILDDDGWVAT